MKRYSIFLLLAILSFPVFAATDTVVTNVVSGSGDVQAISAPGTGRFYRLIFVTVTNTSDVNRAEVTLRNGTSVAGEKLLSKITLNAGESTRIPLGSTGPRITLGLFVDRNSGTTELTIHTQ